MKKVVGYLYACPRCVINAAIDGRMVFSVGALILIDRRSTNCVRIILSKHNMEKLD